MLKASCDQDDCLCLLPPPRLGAEAGLVPDGAEEGRLPHHDKPVVYCHPRHVMRQEDSRWHSTPWLRSSLAPNLKPELDQASRSNLPFTGIPGDRRTGAMTPWGAQPAEARPREACEASCWGLWSLSASLTVPACVCPQCKSPRLPMSGVAPTSCTHIHRHTHIHVRVCVGVCVCEREGVTHAINMLERPVSQL